MPEHRRFNEPIEPITIRRQRLGSEQRRALAMLAEAPFGYTRPALRINRFKMKTLTGLVRDGLASAELETMKVRDTKVVIRFRITDAGRRALE
jgi:hypothetical protein